MASAACGRRCKRGAGRVMSSDVWLLLLVVLLLVASAFFVAAEFALI
jgi:hypothetical protein